jgi:hypothetical protein
VRGQLERRAPPPELDVRVMELGLGDERGARDEPEGVPEVRELERAPKPLVTVALPRRDVGRETRGLLLAEGRRPFLARFAVL